MLFTKKTILAIFLFVFVGGTCKASEKTIPRLTVRAIYNRLHKTTEDQWLKKYRLWYQHKLSIEKIFQKLLLIKNFVELMSENEAPKLSKIQQRIGNAFITLTEETSHNISQETLDEFCNNFPFLKKRVVISRANKKLWKNKQKCAQ